MYNSLICSEFNQLFNHLSNLRIQLFTYRYEYSIGKLSRKKEPKFTLVDSKIDGRFLEFEKCNQTKLDKYRVYDKNCGEPIIEVGIKTFLKFLLLNIQFQN